MSSTAHRSFLPAHDKSTGTSRVKRAYIIKIISCCYLCLAVSVSVQPLSYVFSSTYPRVSLLCLTCSHSSCCVHTHVVCLGFSSHPLSSVRHCIMLSPLCLSVSSPLSSITLLCLSTLTYPCRDRLSPGCPCSLLPPHPSLMIIPSPASSLDILMMVPTSIRSSAFRMPVPRRC